MRKTRHIPFKLHLLRLIIAEPYVEASILYHEWWGKEASFESIHLTKTQGFAVNQNPALLHTFFNEGLSFLQKETFHLSETSFNTEDAKRRGFFSWQRENVARALNLNFGF